MKRSTAFIAAAFFTAATFFSELGASQEIFINSDPIGAEVFLNKVRVGETPVRITASEGESLNIRLVKKGFAQVQKNESIGSGRRQLFFYTLLPLNLRVRFDQKEQDIYINGVRAGKTPVIVKNLPGGVYQIENSEKGIYLSSSGYRVLRRTAISETLFSGILGGASLAGYFYYSGKNREGEANALSLSAAFFSGLLVYNVLKLSKISSSFKRDVKSMSIIEIESPADEGPLEYFSSAMELIGREKWQEALDKFLFIEHIFPDAQVTPISIYETGYCYNRLGNDEKAAEYFRRFIYDYPVYELFPYGVYNLLSAEASLGRVEQAVSDLDALKPVYLEDGSGDLLGDYYVLMVDLFNETGGKNRFVLEELLRELENFLALYPDSPLFPGFHLKKGELLYTYLDREGGEAVLNDLREKYSYDSEIVSEIDRVLHGR